MKIRYKTGLSSENRTGSGESWVLGFGAERKLITISCTHSVILYGTMRVVQCALTKEVMDTGVSGLFICEKCAFFFLGLEVS